ncbi:hypothetical protein GCM10011369_01880 [Neiella marina]|uniref:Fructosamine kinase family protein n=1 Tax=Neiella marina TaxID=508461 RepID=A0A8J2U1X6_9GAMM|nr:fructosamine kinase family protein [Neiella marina]GGA64093.1 hypothetical protein GCM10011369_01880 [Neiella marina]
MQWHHIEQQLKLALGSSLQITATQALSGGDINQAFRLRTNLGDLFIKLNDAGRLDMFEQEALGLAAMAATNTIRTPNVIVTSCTQQHAFLVLQYHEATNPESSDWQLAAEQLAAMHCTPTDSIVANDRFGFNADNYIGSTPQLNSTSKCWSQFFSQQRIGYQLSLLEGRMRLPVTHAELCRLIESIVNTLPAKPSLLHGDLWRGNMMFDKYGPLLIDPACYVGDGEADIAMTELFGGFPRPFYQAYRSIRPASEPISLRHQIYNLYHLLNHANLFGGHYVDQAEKSIVSLMTNGS